MSTRSENHHLLPIAFYTAPLETWADAVQGQSSEAEECVVNVVAHYKALSTMEHEFLVVYATHSSGAQIVLGVDRNNGQGSTRILNALGSAKVTSTSLSQSPSSLGHLADDGVQVSHDGTHMPIFSHHGKCVPLYTITFLPTTDARPPSLLQLSVLLLTIRTRFPSYALLKYQCYFFARATCLSLMELFGGVVTDLESERAATCCGVHVSRYPAVGKALSPLIAQKMVSLSVPVAMHKIPLLVASGALKKMLLMSVSPWLLLPGGIYGVYGLVKLSGEDTRRIR